MTTTSKKLKDLRMEVQAQKIAFQRAATKLNLYTKTITFNTKKNACTWTETNPPFTFDYEDNERVVVTLTTPSGVNTLANLELVGNYDTLPTVERVPYSGGARWHVTTSPRYNWDDHTWLPTTYTFTVQTLVNGTLSAAMYWEV